MLRATILFSVLVFGAVGLSAQDDLAQYQTMMRAAVQANGALTAAVNAKEVAAGATAGNNAAAAFDKLAAYWKAKGGADDAVTFAQAARDAAKAAADAKTPEDMQAAAAKINPNCGGCHMAHRGGSRGNFTIK
jgi:mono/diheme cytochrome c family protein